MTDASPVHLSSGLPETALPADPPDVRTRLAEAVGRPPGERRAALAAVVADHPRLLSGWAELGDVGRDPIEAYAYYRVGYHRGLDALRANGWRGSGYVRWRHETNRGFLRCVDGLGRIAGVIGEREEAARCAEFVRQLDPDWDRRPA